MRTASLALFLLLPAAIAGATCPAITPSNVYIAFTDDGAICSLLQPVCPLGRPVTFTAATFGYTFSCGAHVFAWDFGDGTRAIVNSPAAITHTFVSGGAHEVSLQIRNPNGTSTLKQVVHLAVLDPAEPAVTFDVSRVSLLEFAFTPSLPPGVTKLTWDFGDGTTFDFPGRNVHRYATTGVYTVTVRAESDQGGSSVYALEVDATAPRQRAARH